MASLPPLPELPTRHQLDWFDPRDDFDQEVRERLEGYLDPEALTAASDARYATRKLAAPIATGTAASGTLPPAVAGHTFREYPTFTKHPEPILRFSEQSAPSMLAPIMIDMRGWPGALDNVYLFYSTDHGTDNATTGLYLVTMSDMLGTNRVDRGKVLGGTTGVQPEAPSGWLDWDAGLIRLMVSVQTTETWPDEPQQVQKTVMYTSATGLADSWTYAGDCMVKPSAYRPGVPVTEYCRTWRNSDTMHAWTIDGGGAFAHWVSTRGGLPGTWTIDGGRILNESDRICHLPDYEIKWLVKFNTSTVINQRGVPWFVGAITGPAAGVEGFALTEVYVAPLRPDYRGLAAAPVKVTPPQAPFEIHATIAQPGTAAQFDSRIYLPYRTDVKTSDFGVMILNEGAYS